MKRILSALVVSGLLALGVTAVAIPSSASPLTLGATTANALEAVGAQSESKNMVKVDHRRHHFGPNRRGPHFGPGPARPPWSRHRHHRNDWHHHRRHRGGGWGPWWGGPRSSFNLELDIAPRPRYRQAPRYALPAAHVRWCEARYRSYRISDNSFQPYNGPRRQCVSPYY